MNQDYNNMTVRQLKSICRKNNITGYSKLRKTNLINHITTFFSKSNSNSKPKNTKQYIPHIPFVLMNKYQLIMECKKLKIKKYSKWNKKTLIQNLCDFTKKQQSNIIKNENNLFCYPEIIDTIYQYVNISSIDIYRTNIIQEYNQQELLKYQELYDNLIILPIRERKYFLRNNGFLSKYSIIHKIRDIKIINMALSDIIKKKENCYLWLSILKYTVSRKMLKSELIDLVINYYHELNLSHP